MDLLFHFKLKNVSYDHLFTPFASFSPILNHLYHRNDKLVGGVEFQGVAVGFQRFEYNSALVLNDIVTIATTGVISNSQNV